MRKGKQASQNDEGFRKYFEIMFGFGESKVLLTKDTRACKAKKHQ
jgi:hypothetical protein